jgi:predicted dinucleotide-binding enzyme
MKVAVLGAGRIGGNVARRPAGAGHEVQVAFARDSAKLGIMEAPRRDGAVYGDEWRLADGYEVAAAVAEGAPIPPTPVY